MNDIIRLTADAMQRQLITDEEEEEEEEEVYSPV